MPRNRHILSWLNLNKFWDSLAAFDEGGLEAVRGLLSRRGTSRRPRPARNCRSLPPLVEELEIRLIPVTGSNQALTLTAYDLNASVYGQPHILLPVQPYDPTGAAWTITAVGAPSHGTAAILPNQNLSYVPDDGFHGSDSFAYTIADSNGDTATAAVNINIYNALAAEPALLALLTAATTPDDANASPNTGTLTVFRAGDTTNPLPLTCTIGEAATTGSASWTLTGLATIPAGQANISLSVTPYLDQAPGTGAITLALTPGPAGSTGPESNMENQTVSWEGDGTQSLNRP